jgi:hypothetical protein
LFGHSSHASAARDRQTDADVRLMRIENRDAVRIVGRHFVEVIRLRFFEFLPPKARVGDEKAASPTAACHM